MDVMTNVGISACLYGGGALLYNKYWSKSKKSESKIPGVHSWQDICWKATNFVCPKCLYVMSWKGAFSVNEESPTICSCEEYHREHFHFQCKGSEEGCCGYACIVKTADDTD